jgi:hypothetical protein
VQLLLKKGTSIDVEGTYRETALNVVASRGHQTVVQLLLAKGANVDAKSPVTICPCLRGWLVAGLPLTCIKGGALGYKSMGRSHLHDSTTIINTINYPYVQVLYL